MRLIELLEQAPKYTWAGIYARILACILIYGALVHVGNIAGWSGTRWSDTPALWLRFPWSLIAFVIGIVTLQLIP